MRPMMIEFEESELKAKDGFWVWTSRDLAPARATPAQAAMANLLQEARGLLDRSQRALRDRYVHSATANAIDSFLDKTSAPEQVVPTPGNKSATDDWSELCGRHQKEIADFGRRHNLPHDPSMPAPRCASPKQLPPDEVLIRRCNDLDARLREVEGLVRR